VYKALAELYKKKNDGGRAYYYLKKYMEEEGKINAARLTTMNKATENFISEIKVSLTGTKMIFRYLLHCLLQYSRFQEYTSER
jgi:hypothetical protein